MNNINKTEISSRNFSKANAQRRHSSFESNIQKSQKSRLVYYFERKNPFQFKNSHKLFKIFPTKPFDLDEKKRVFIGSSIYDRIVGTPSNVNDFETDSRKFKIRSEIRHFWKKAISEQILLNRMEYKNKLYRLRANNTKRHLHFSYVEITPCLKAVDLFWEKCFGDPDYQFKEEDIFEAFSKGVPQAKRGDVWIWLAQRSKNQKTQNTKISKELSYQELLKQTTIHQHSILLDLSRTFPNNSNFSKKFGEGQLALFNVLKAYSILDKEVGYCQGLSFIVGILLIHVSNVEEKAFDLLKFLLIDLNLREQYKPDMKRLQRHMYQFSRLLYEECFQLYKLLEDNEIAPSCNKLNFFLNAYS